MAVSKETLWMHLYVGMGGGGERGGGDTEGLSIKFSAQIGFEVNDVIKIIEGARWYFRTYLLTDTSD